MHQLTQLFQQNKCFNNDSGFATEIYVNNKVSSVYKLKGSVLIILHYQENLTVGDVYNLLDTGIISLGWNTWDKLGGTVDLTSYELLSNKVSSWVKQQRIQDIQWKLVKET